MTLLDQVKAATYVALTFDEVRYPAPTYMVLVASDDLVNWRTLKRYNFGVRDPTLIRNGDIYYGISTNGLMRTTDFETWTWLDYPLVHSNNVWAPELFKDKQGNWHVVYASNAPNNPNLDPFWLCMADFDPGTGTISNIDRTVSGDWGGASIIDPNITIINGKYYLWAVSNLTHGPILFVADDYMGPYSRIDTNLEQLDSGLYNEAPEMVVVGDQAWLFTDPWTPGCARKGISYSTASIGDLTKWQGLIQVNSDFVMRHFGIMVTTVNATLPLSLQRLSDNNLSVVLLNNVYKNGTAVLSVIDQLYQDLDGLFYFGVPTLPTLGKCPSDYLNRAAYLWLNQLFSLLQDALNSLIIRFNQYGIVGAPNYTDTPQISLWRPQQLSLATYQININQNWQSIEDKLNDCYLYLKPYLREGVS